MFGHRISWIACRNKSCSSVGPGEKKTFREPTQLPITDPKYIWSELPNCQTSMKTWRDIEEEHACALLIRFALKNAPERRMFNIESNDIYICRRGCLHPCIPLPCEDIVYPSIWEKLFCRFKRLTALAIFLGLIYATYGLKVWGPTGPALDTVLGDSDNKIDQVTTAGTVATSWWNRAVAVMFSGVKWIFPIEEQESEFDEEDFILTLQEDVQEKKDKKSEPIIKEDPTVFQEWELVYNYVPEAAKHPVEIEDVADWYWMEHEDPEFVKATKPNMPYEASARLLTKMKGQVGVTLASIYTDLCSEWSISKGSVEDVEIECFEDTELGKICKRKRERRQKVRINPQDCKTCPFTKNEEEEGDPNIVVTKKN